LYLSYKITLIRFNLLLIFSYMKISNHFRNIKLLVVMVVFSGLITTQCHSQSATGYGLPVLKGVKGFGLDSKGGSGGEIIKVTNLNREGEGSFASALGHEGPRIIVFEVAGVIDLDRKSLRITNPFVTIACQTAPSAGITLIRGGLSVQTHDVIIQHLKIRPGEAGQEKKSGWEVDGIGCSKGAWNVIIDHCSVTWSTDENISPSGPRFDGAGPDEWRENTSHKVVISNCIIAEGLSNSTHSKGEHSKGTLVHDNASEILITGNLYASNMQRNPLFKGGARGVVVNNYIYNPGNAAIHFGLVEAEWEGHDFLTGIMVVEGNYIEAGPDTRSSMAAGSFRGPVEVFWNENAIVPVSDRKELTGTFTRTEQKPFWPEGLKAIPSGEVKKKVLENAGAFPWDRDPIDKRIIEAAARGTGRLINSENEVGGYPTFKPVYRKFNPVDWDLETMTMK
jgi:pectate lyase